MWGLCAQSLQACRHAVTAGSRVTIARAPFHSSSSALARARSPRLTRATADESLHVGGGGAGAPSSEEDAPVIMRMRGAHYHKQSGKWTSTITVQGERRHLGVFDSAEAAAAAYASALQEYAPSRGGRPGAAAQSDDAPPSSRGASARGRVSGTVAGDFGVGRKALITRAEAEALGLPVLDFDSDSDEERTGRGGEGGGAAPEAAASLPPAPPPPRIPGSVDGYIGVVKADAGPGLALWEAVYVLQDGREVSGGEYESELEAAKAYDALARMYGGEGAPTNLPMDAYTAWVPPEDVVNTGQIETVVGVPLTVEEIMAGLTQERGLAVRAVDLKGKSDIADALVFVTGRSAPHMRRMADMVSRALRKRRLPGIEDPSVENREGDDWMVVDCGNVIVNVMDPDAREVFDLEAFYENMKLGEDPYAGMTYDDFLNENPIPDKWLKRLEKDDVEFKAARTVYAPNKQGPNSVGVGGPSWATAGGARAAALPGARGGPDRRVSAYHFPAKLRGKPKT